MTALEVDYKYSLHQSGHEGRWNINKDKGAITFNLPLIYEHAAKVAEWLKMNPEDRFIEQLIEVELIERICIERAHEKIKIKGSRCKPFCCVESVALHMAYPFAWRQVKDYVKSLKEYAGATP